MALGDGASSKGFLQTFPQSRERDAVSVGESEVPTHDPSEASDKPELPFIEEMLKYYCKKILGCADK